MKGFFADVIKDLNQLSLTKGDYLDGFKLIT